MTFSAYSLNFFLRSLCRTYANQPSNAQTKSAIAPRILLYCEIITTITDITAKFITESGHADKFLGTG